MIEEEGSITFDCLCQAPLSSSGPTIAHPSTLGSPGIRLQAVVLPPLLPEKVGARLSRFCDVWRRKGCNGWVCKALEIRFQLCFRECAPRTCTPSPFVDRGPLLKMKTLSALVHNMWRNEAIKIIRTASSPGFYSRLFLVPKTSGGKRPVIDISLLNTFLEIPHFIDLIDAYFHITIHQGYRKFLWFQTRDAFYQFRALPFDLSPAPWVFTKVTVEIKVLVHGMGSNLCQYLDG